MAEVVALIDRNRDEYLSHIPKPTSFEDCKREQFQRATIIRRWELEREGPWHRLCQYMAAEWRGDYVFLMPVEREHVEAARLLVQKFAHKVD